MNTRFPHDGPTTNGTNHDPGVDRAGTSPQEDPRGQEDMALNRFVEMVQNIWQGRMSLFNRLLGGGSNQRIDDECGYLSLVTADMYRELYDRNAIAERVVNLMPRECWQVSPLVYEDESTKESTPFEAAWDSLGAQLTSWGLRKTSKWRGNKGKAKGGITKNAPFTPGKQVPGGKADEGSPVDKGASPKGAGKFGSDKGDNAKSGDEGDDSTETKKQPDDGTWYQDEEGSIVWSYLLRADILSGIGTFGCILIGIDDGLNFDQPVEGFPPDGGPPWQTMTGMDQSIYGTPGNPAPSGSMFQSSGLGTDAQYYQAQFTPPQQQNPRKGDGKERQITFLRVFDESLVQVVQYEASRQSPRFGHPIMYLITMNDPKQTHSGVGLPIAQIRVHWSRVVHIAENDGVASEIWAKPRMRPTVNNIVDLKKVYGSSGEAFWRSCFAALSLETVPQLGGDVIVDRPALKQMMQEFYAGLDRTLMLGGMSAKTLAPSVTDPTSQVAIQIEAICINLGCPVRVFKGSERGELASSQDDSSWNDRVRHRQKFYVSPRVIAPFIDRLIAMNVLPEPEGYSIEWPDLDSVGKKDKAAIALQVVQAIAAFVAGNCESIITVRDLLVKVLGWDEEEADAVMADVEQQQEEKAQEDAALAEEHGMIPEAPPGFQHPEPAPPPMPGMKGGPPVPPVKMNPGQSLVHPQTGATVAKTAPPPPKPSTPAK